MPPFKRDVYISTDRIQPFADRFLTLLPEDDDAMFEVHAFINPYIRSTLAELEERETRTKEGLPVGPERTDLLWSMVTNLRVEEELRSQLCLTFVPTNETTSIFISNCLYPGRLYHFARHPEAWLRLEMCPLLLRCCAT